MRIIRFRSAGKVYFGQPIDSDTGRARRIEGDLFGSLRVTDDVLPVDKLLAPIVPTDILCIGLNYREHAAESGSAVPVNPMLFIKSSNTLKNPFEANPVPRPTQRNADETELAALV